MAAASWLSLLGKLRPKIVADSRREKPRTAMAPILSREAKSSNIVSNFPIRQCRRFHFIAIWGERSRRQLFLKTKILSVVFLSLFDVRDCHKNIWNFIQTTIGENSDRWLFSIPLWIKEVILNWRNLKWEESDTYDFYSLGINQNEIYHDNWVDFSVDWDPSST